MNSLRELTRSTHKTCDLRDWARDRKISVPLSLRQLMDAFSSPKVWGFADLHAHPASHLAFGANADGTNGPLYGNPSCLPVEAATSTISIDLAPCDGHQHSPSGFNIDPAKSDVDPVRIIHRMSIMFGIEKNLFHSSSGSPDFDSWPSASSKSHQQMHITCIHRAWQGGLRIMVASVTDNQLLSRLWNHGVDFSYPDPDTNFDFQSARRQLQFIHAQALANSTWMEVVTSSAEARQAISDNKLAVILGVEMDSLTAEQIIALKNEFGVCQVVPIHLANNSFGGVAIYEDEFNTNNWYLHNGKCFLLTDDHHLESFFQVESDPNLSFRLTKPQFLLPLTAITPVDPTGIILPLGIPIPPGVILPLPVTDSDYDNLGYKNVNYGHRNQLGLIDNGSEILKLMKKGFIIDLAHMSEKSQDNALSVAEQFGYPLVNTHTAMRPDEWKERTSERDIPKRFVDRLSKLEGVIGIGTSGYRDKDDKPIEGVDQMRQWIEDYLEIWGAMHFRGVGIGTDANGLSPLIPNSERRFSYAVAGLPQSQMGTKVFDFANDGLAHYGMLADFIHALRTYDVGSDVANLLFHTAEETINMWERVEQAATKIP